MNREYVEIFSQRGQHNHAAMQACAYCKARDIKETCEIITWVTPEGGSGPNYQNL